MSHPHSKEHLGCSSGQSSMFTRLDTSSSDEHEEQDSVKRMRLTHCEQVSDSDITDVVEELSIKEIYKVYEKLQIKHKVVEKFEQKAGTRDPDEQAKTVLRDYWRQREGTKATQKAILRALEQCELIDSMQKLQKKWKVQDHSQIEQGGIVIKPTWTKDGLSLNPKVSGFDNMDKIRISYSYGITDECETGCETYPLSDLPHILKGVNNAWSGIVTATASDEMNVARCQVPVEREFDLQTSKQAIAELYQRKIKHMVMFPWQQHHHQVKHIEDIYVQLELERAVRRNKEVLILSEEAAGSNAGTELITKEDFISLRTSEGKEVKRIILKGLAGSGKSSLLSKLAYDWSQKGKSSLSQFELVILLRMNKLEQNCDLIDAMSTQIIPLSESEKPGFRNYLNQNQREIIILMDAWDETKLQDISVDETYPGSLTIEQILASQKLPKALVIISSRPHKPLGTVQSDYVPVNLKGFSHDNIDTYISKFFYDSKNRDSVNEMIHQVHSSAMLQTIAAVPVILMILCTVWDSQRKFPKTLFSLYDKFLTIIWKRFKHYWKNETHLPFPVFQNKIGAIAFQGLLSSERIEEDTIEFPEEHFSEICDVGLKVGFITKGWNFTDEEESFITFLHKSVQEFLAGKYFAQMYTDKPEEFKNTLKRIDSWKLVLQKFEVLKFCCGIPLQQNEYSDSNSGSVAIIGHIIKKYDEFYKAQNVSADKKKMCKYNDEHNVHVQSYIDVGDIIKLNRTHANAIDCLPILTLLHEAQLHDVTTLPSLFSDSVFSKPMSFAINCQNSQTLMLFHNFLQSVGIATVNIKSIWMTLVGSKELVPGILSHLPHLQCLAYLGSPVGKSLNKSVAKLTYLSTLILDNMSIDMCDLLSLLSISPHKSLRHVDFTGAPIGDAISEIGAVMSPLLTCLILSDTDLREKHIKILSEHLHNTPHLRILDLSENDIGESIDVLAQNLQHCKQIQTLRLECTQLEENHIQTLITFLSSRSVDLLELNLFENSVGNNITALSNHLQHCKQLQVLNLSYTNLDAHHMKIMAVLPQKLQELYFSGNVVGDSLICLIRALQHCQQLTVLGLNDTHLTDSGVVALGQHVRHWSHLSTLRLGDNDEIGNSGLDAIFTHIHHLQKLTEFTISATIDSSCSTFVKNCLRAIEQVIPEEGGRVDVKVQHYNPGYIQSILKLSSSRSTIKVDNDENSNNS